MKKHLHVPVAAVIALGVGAGAAISTVPSLAETSYAAEPAATQATLIAGTPGQVGPTAAPGPALTAPSPVSGVPVIQYPAWLAPAPAPAVVVVPVNEDSGPSKWEGKTLRDADGSKLPAQVTRWANIVVAVMDEHKIPRKYLPGILAQIKQESNGNPKSVNNYDSNAAAGTPSMGLLQVIAPTYQTHAKPGFKNLRYQAVPYTNIWSALRYVKKSYGMNKFSTWNQGANHAY
ncbi:MAG: transglycosylase SLT domain-containing protein [Actinobacteria bacterium]|nr:transglycosylase SLT domain-containing protein [Actinomycetota bacterium]